MPELSYNVQERIARQLESIEGRFEELSIRITLPEVISDSALFTRLIREHADLEELNAIAAMPGGPQRLHERRHLGQAVLAGAQGSFTPSGSPESSRTSLCCASSMGSGRCARYSPGSNASLST